MKNTFYSQGNPYNIVRTTSATYTASVGELIIADETEITLPSGVPAGSVIAVRSSSDTVTTDVVGASGSIDGFSAGTTHQEAKTGEYVYDGSDWYLRNDVDISNAAIPDSGIERYTLDTADTDGSTVYGVWGDNNGTLNNVTTGVTGIADTYDSGQAYNFDGSTTEVDLQNLNSEIQAFAFWLRPDNIMDGTHSHCHIGFGNGYSVREGGGFNGISARAIGVNGGPLDTETSVTDGVSYTSGSSHHFVFNWNGTRYNIYHNAQIESVDSGSGGHSPLITDQPSFSIGYRQSNNDFYYLGGVDDIRFYNQSLTNTEISNLYNTGSING